MKIIFTPFIKLYQLFSSTSSPRCKYYPSCSNYALTAVKRHGAKGVVMATWRVLRCNPWSLGGVDYVDEEIDCADAVNARNNTLVGAK
jgi:putative membrane protein insertion efficiency factor